MIKNFIVTIMVVCSFIGCTTVRYVPVKGEDIIKTEYKEIIKDSLIYIKVPDESVKNRTADTTSFLETSVAKSNASIRNGKLNHTLENKKDSIPTKIIYKDIIKIDSVYVEKPVIQEVEKPIRDKWFYYSLMINLIFVLFIIGKVKKFISL